MQRDYFLRMIEQFGFFVAALRRSRETQAWEIFDKDLEEGYGRFAGVSPSLVHAISEDDLMTMLHARGAVDLDRWWGLAELLREEGLALEARGLPAGNAFLKSLRVYLEVLEEADEVPRQLRVSDLEDVIQRVTDQDLTLTDASRRMLTTYLVSLRRFDRAENLILMARESTPDAEGPRAEAERFYAHLERYADEELEAGGLSREEVTSGLAASQDR